MILLEMSIMGAVLTGLITLIRKIAGQRLLPACYLAFWALAVSRFLLPIEIVSPFSVYNLFHRIKHTAAEVQYLAVPEAAVEAVSWVNNGLVYGNENSINWLFVIWLSGAVLCFIYMAGSHWQCQRLYAASLPLEEAFVKQWHAEHPLHRKYEIRRSERIFSPLTYGLFHPVILLPATQDFREEELNLVLLHEWNHIRHLDILWLWVLLIICSIHWFNPMVWVLYVLCRQDLELRCDASVIKQIEPGGNYSYAVLLLQQAASMKHSAIMFSPSRFTGYQRMEERIETIMKPKTFTWKIATATVLLLCIGGTAFATSARDDITGNPLQSDDGSVQQLAWPVDTDAGVWVSGTYGERVHPVNGEVLFSDSIIISGQEREGEPVLAAADGVVKAGGFDAQEGYYLTIDHGDGMETCYGHCEALLVKEDDTVKAGQQIATLGRTGKVTGPCLSFSVYKNGEPTDPMPILQPAE